MKMSTIYFTAGTVSRMTASELVEFVGCLGDDTSYRLRRELASGPYAARIDATERRLAEKAAPTSEGDKRSSHVSDERAAMLAHPCRTCGAAAGVECFGETLAEDGFVHYSRRKP